eukprot:6316220-Amphidinium_carterae.1
MILLYAAAMCAWEGFSQVLSIQFNNTQFDNPHAHDGFHARLVHRFRVHRLVDSNQRYHLAILHIRLHPALVLHSPWH